MKNKFIKYHKEILFTLMIFLIFITIINIIPLGNAPDEYERYRLANFMYNNNAFPIASDPQVRILNWGFSYATSPFLSYMVGALFMKCMALFSTNAASLMLSARFASACFSIITVVYVFRIAKLLFTEKEKWLFVVLTCCLPSFIFVSSYVNCDALAITSTSIIIYAWIVGRRTNWNRSSCVNLIIGLSLCVLSYKNAYGYILLTFFLFIYESYISYKNKNLSVILKKAMIIASCVAVLSGWHYVRNYFIYDGDIMGTKTDIALSEKYGIEELKPSNRINSANSGESMTYMLFDKGWIESSYTSFIGKFGYMTLPLPNNFISWYNLVFCSGLVGLFFAVIKRKFTSNNKVLYLLLSISIVIPIILSCVYSYFGGYQAQGRYLLPMLIPLMILVSKGCLYLFRKVSFRYFVLNVVISIFLLLNIILIINVFANAYL